MSDLEQVVFQYKKAPGLQVELTATLALGRQFYIAEEVMDAPKLKSETNFSHDNSLQS